MVSGKTCGDRLGKALQPVHYGDQGILKPMIAQFVPSLTARTSHPRCRRSRGREPRGSPSRVTPGAMWTAPRLRPCERHRQRKIGRMGSCEASLRNPSARSGCGCVGKRGACFRPGRLCPLSDRLHRSRRIACGSGPPHRTRLSRSGRMGDAFRPSQPTHPLHLLRRIDSRQPAVSGCRDRRSFPLALEAASCLDRNARVQPHPVPCHGDEGGRSCAPAACWNGETDYAENLG